MQYGRFLFEDYGVKLENYFSFLLLLFQIVFEEESSQRTILVPFCFQSLQNIFFSNKGR